MYKILIAAPLYTPYIKGGGELSTQILAETLVSLGYDVVIVTIAKSNSVEVINKVKVIRMKTPNIYWAYESNKENKFKKIIWHMIDAWNINVLKPFSKILDDEKPKIVHSSSIEDISPYIWRICNGKSIPVLHTLRSYTLMCPKSSMFKNGKNCNKQCFSCKIITYPKKILSKYVNGVVGISKFILDTHIDAKYFINAKKMVIFNSVKVDTVLEKQENERKIVGYVGQLSESKGIEDLLDAFLSIDEFDLYIYGEARDINYEKYLKNKYKKYNIYFKGYFNNQAKIYSTIDLLVVTSLWNEPFGRIVVEAYSYGLPVLANKSGGIPEIIYDKKHLYSQSKNEIVTKIKEIINESIDKYHLIEYSKNYDKDTIALKYIDAYNELIDDEN